ncbi:MAG: SAM-dependent methyltransferase [Pseudomonadota bacterium]
MKSHLQNLIQINGAISISQFMNEALFRPQLGYYQQQNPFGKDGDFITAPEISQVFGELIGAYLMGIWQNNYSGKKINLVEMGAGRGTLMKDFLAVAKKIPEFLANVNISVIEISPRLQEVQKQNLQGFKVDWYNNFAEFYCRNNDAPILFIANELFDCFAIDQFVKTQNGWAQKMVGIDANGELEFVLGNLMNIKVGVTNPDQQNLGSIFEHSSQAMSFMNELSEAIKKTNGLGLIIDYGYIKNEFKNTLQAIKNHQFCDVLKEAGNCDITALVDFANLQKIAQKNNLQTSLITQKEFLNSLGIESRREKLLAKKNPEEQNQINSSINRLIDEKQMGELFKVLIIW